MKMARPDKRPTADQLRARINRGATKGKAGPIDPAAAPLPTDQEAAGTRPPFEQFAAAAHEELIRSSPQRPSRGSTVVIVFVVVLTAAAGFAAIFLSAP